MPAHTALAAALALLVLTATARVQASRDMLVNVPQAGDAMLLTQPSYEYSPEGPGTLKYVYRWQHDRRESEFDLGLTPEEAKHDARSPLSWDQVVALPLEPPAPVGKSEERIVNMAMLLAQQRDFQTALHKTSAAGEN